MKRPVPSCRTILTLQCTERSERFVFQSSGDPANLLNREKCGMSISVGFMSLSESTPLIRHPSNCLFPPVQNGPGAHPVSCKLGTGSFPGVKCGRCVLLTTHPLLVPRSWKSRAIPLPTLWATPGPQWEHTHSTIYVNGLPFLMQDKT